MVQHRWFSAAIIGGWLVVACSSTAASPTATPAAAPSAAVATATGVTTPSAGATVPAVTAKATVPVDSQGQVIWTQVFPPGPGQALVLQNCGTCHGYDRIVTGQRTAAGWARIRADHASKVPNLSAEDQDTLYNYLAANFNPSKPERIIPTTQPSGPSSPV